MDVSEKSLLGKRNELRILFAVLTVILSVILFGKIYPDSTQYIAYVEQLAGMSTEIVRPPFIYRPLLPLITFVFSAGLNVSFVMSMLNMVFLVVMTDSIFNLTMKVGGRLWNAVIATFFATCSFPLIWYGAVPLTDALAMLLFVAIIAAAELNYGDIFVAHAIFAGVFVKEIVLIFGLYYVVRMGWKKLWVLLISTTR